MITVLDRKFFIKILNILVRDKLRNNSFQMITDDKMWNGDLFLVIRIFIYPILQRDGALLLA